MIAAEVMVPCVSTAANCRLDWAAIAALGGWVAATVTFFAVLLPYRQYRKERADREEAILQDARTQMRSMTTLLSAAYAIGRVVPGQLADPGIKPADEEALFEWIAFFKAAPMPQMAWHPALADHREAVLYFSLCIDAFNGYKRGQLRGVARDNLLGAIRNLDEGARDVARLVHAMTPGSRLAENFPEYFAGDPEREGSD